MITESEILKKIKSGYYYSLKEVPEELRTEKVCVNALQRNFEDSIRYVPSEILTDAFLSKRIRSTKKAMEIVGYKSNAFLKYIPDSLKNSDVCLTSIAANPNNFKYLPDSFINEEFLMEMLLINGELLKFVPQEMRTREVCQKAFNQNKSAFQYFPEALITLDDCESYIKEAWRVTHIPKKLLSAPLIALGIRSKPHRQDRMFYNDIPKSLITVELMVEMVKLDGHYLYRMGSEWERLGFLTEENLHKLVSVNGYCLEGIDKLGLITDELCLSALNTEYERLPKKARGLERRQLKYFPKEIISTEVANKAIAVEADNIQYIPKAYQTYELCELAIMQNAENIKHISKKMITLELCVAAVRSSHYAINYIPNKYNKAHPYLMANTVICRDVETCYPSAKEFGDLIAGWIADCEIDESDIRLCLSHSPSKLKKTQVWKKYALMLNLDS
mgnify:CR=1 FL=1